MTSLSGRTRRAASRAATGAILGSLTLFLFGCASTGGSGSSVRGDVITAEDLAETPYSDVYEVLVQHRRLEFEGDAMFMRNRGQTTFQEEVPVLIVVDGSPLGTSARSLSSMPIESIQRIEFVQPTQAGARYGTRGGGGAVVITTT